MNDNIEIYGAKQNNLKNINLIIIHQRQKELRIIIIHLLN